MRAVAHQSGFIAGEKEGLYRIREGSRSKRRRRNRKTAPGPRRKMTKSKKMTKKKSKKQQKRGGRISLRWILENTRSCRSLCDSSKAKRNA